MSDHPSQALAQHLDQSRTVGDFEQAASESLHSYDDLGERLIKEGGVNLACRAGCSLCCSLRVDVLAHEVFSLAHHILAHFSREEIVALTARLEAHEDRVLGLTPFEHATSNNRCPLLVDDRCSVYEARPRSCRRHHSQDLAACQYTFDHPTDLETPAAHDRNLYRTLTGRLQHDADAYLHWGYDATVYELGTALAEALADPAAWGRWWRGRAAFLRASVTPTG